MRCRWVWLGAVVLCTACTNTDASFDFGPSDARFLEAGSVCTDPLGDEDGDGIPNGEEGCAYSRDSDHDKIPDWQDFDSDNDGIPDKTEAGAKDGSGSCAAGQPGGKPGKNKWPCDSDGDGIADYLDIDSDNDGVLDKDEDVTGDGLLGCCLTACNKPDAKWQAASCILTADGCGSGQKCVSGKCTPAVDFVCSNGETNPKLKDTFGDGKLDNERGTFICRDATEDKPKGRKAVQLRKSAIVKDSTGKELGGDWNVAMETFAKYSELAIQDAASKEAAAVIDQDGGNAETAGFVISKVSTKSVQEELADLIAALTKKIPGGGGKISVRASGIEGHSHDKFDTVQGTILDLDLSGSSNVSSVRNETVGTMLGKSMGQLGNLPGAYGLSTSQLIIRFVTVKRFEFQRDAQKKLILDAKGNPIDTGDQSKWRLLVMGAVAARGNYQDPTRVTGFLVDDLSGGTALATSSDTVGNDCDVGTISSLPVADIIWVVDESGSMDTDRQNIVNNANNFFSRALSSGLDFRMGVTGVNAPNGSYKTAVGKFCSKISTTSSDDGGTDRFLTPSEGTIFSSCIKNPPGYEGGNEYGLINGDEAVKKHLPRAGNDPAKIRPEAKLVLIIATDEVPNETYSPPASLSSSDYSKCQLDASKQTGLNQLVKPYLDLLSGITDPEAAAMYHVIGGVCNNSCGADVSHGYRELAQALGGQIADVCQTDLGNTLQVIIDSIIGAASPVTLEHVPISASLAVALDGVEVLRSRNNGFDYRSSSNSLVFINVKYKKGSEVIASYKRWERQLDPDKL